MVVVEEDRIVSRVAVAASCDTVEDTVVVVIIGTAPSIPECGRLLPEPLLPL